MILALLLATNAHAGCAVETAPAPGDLSGAPTFAWSGDCAAWRVVFATAAGDHPTDRVTAWQAEPTLTVPEDRWAAWSRLWALGISWQVQGRAADGGAVESPWQRLIVPKATAAEGPHPALSARTDGRFVVAAPGAERAIPGPDGELVLWPTGAAVDGVTGEALTPGPAGIPWANGFDQDWIVGDRVARADGSAVWPGAGALAALDREDGRAYYLTPAAVRGLDLLTGEVGEVAIPGARAVATVGDALWVVTERAVHAVDAESGSTLWTRPIDVGAPRIAAAGETLVVGGPAGLVALDVDAVRWRAPAEVRVAPIVAGGLVVTAGEAIEARELATGAIRWSAPYEAASLVAGDDGRVYASLREGRAVALGPAGSVDLEIRDVPVGDLILVDGDLVATGGGLVAAVPLPPGFASGLADAPWPLAGRDPERTADADPPTRRAAPLAWWSFEDDDADGIGGAGLPVAGEAAAELPAEEADLGDGPLTVSAWVRIEGDGDRAILTQGGAGLVAPAEAADGAWHHLALVQDGACAGCADLFVDGEVVATFDGAALDPASPWLVGGAWTGVVDELRVWDEALGDDDVAWVACADAARSGGVVEATRCP